MNYNIAETFYSIQGEGEWSGTPMFFIRLSGCNLGCKYCDTDYNHVSTMNEDTLVALALRHPARKVMITGGEPLLQPTQPLVVALRAAGFKTHLETNGTQMTHFDWDWIAVSPKGPVSKLDPQVMMFAAEIKFLAGYPGWKEYINEVHGAFNLSPKGVPPRIRWIMPIARAYPHRDLGGIIDENVKEAIQYCLEHPAFKLCCQIHKYVGIK